MTLHEEITALLHGDIADEDRIAELMHVLAVSPEKRALFVEQIRLSRAFTTLSASVTPPRAADQAIWQGLAAVDAAMAGGSASKGTPASARPEGGREFPGGAGVLAVQAAGMPLWTKILAMVSGLLVISFVMAVQRITWSEERNTLRTVSALGSETVRNDEPEAAAHLMRDGGAVTGEAVTGESVASLRDSLAAVRARLGSLALLHEGTLQELAALRTRGPEVRVVYRDRILPSTVAADTTGDEVEVSPNLQSGGAQVPVAMAQARSTSAVAERRTPRDAELSSAARLDAHPIDADDEDEAGGVGPWQAGIRDNFRLSLPRVYGLGKNRSIFLDKDIFVSYRLDGTGILSSMKLMATGGETQFSQVYYSTDSDNEVQVKVEQSPSFEYGRLMLAPELVRTANVTGGIEFGAGLALSRLRPVGPIATFGINLEYRPIDRIALQGGVSGWMLWSQYRTQTITSTNLNGHLGFAIGF